MTDKELLAYARRYVTDQGSPIHSLGAPPSSMLKYNIVGDGDKLLWDNVTPNNFIHVEPLDENFENFQIYIENANGRVSGAYLDIYHLGYTEIFRKMLARFNNAEHATVVTSFAWLQHYRLRKSVFAANPDSNDWVLYEKDMFLKTGKASMNRIVKNDALQALYPKAKDLLDYIRGLDITSLDAEDLLRKTCCFYQTVVRQDAGYAPLPEDFNSLLP